MLLCALAAVGSVPAVAIVRTSRSLMVVVIETGFTGVPWIGQFEGEAVGRASRSLIVFVVAIDFDGVPSSGR